MQKYSRGLGFGVWVEWFAGNFTDYEQDRRKRLADAGLDATPTRVRYKPLER